MPPVRTAKRSIVVAGDVTMDWNLARTRGVAAARAAWNSDDCTRAYWQRGGAAMLGDLVEHVAARAALDGLGQWVVRQAKTPRREVHLGDRRYEHSYAQWKRFSHNAGDGEPDTWRVEEFLGVDVCGSGRVGEWQHVDDDDAGAPLVVLDDAALGFRDRRALWPKAIVSRGRRPWVVVKMARPVAEGALWKHLRRRHAERVIVVMAANDLRLAEVRISRNLSWERTAEEAVWELVYNPRLEGLTDCAHVVVSFQAAGALLLSPQMATRSGTGAVRAPCATLYFDPEANEGSWEQARPGGMIGYASCLAAAVAEQVLRSPREPDLAAAIQNGVRAMRALHQDGYGVRGAGAPSAALTFPTARVAAALAGGSAPLASCPVPDPTATGDGATAWTILGAQHRDRTLTTAEDVALHGVKHSLHDVPIAEYGGLQTVDRQEIEELRSISTLILEYARERRSEQPLSIAVFGPPGAGKSFGIKQVVKAVLPGQVAILEFNLSQLDGPASLHDAFHQVRDAGLRGVLPLVFWDEFDTRLLGQDLGWLRYFLSPMQDGTFQQGQLVHPIGRAIFVFAGGINASMERFTRDLTSDEIRKVKLPDFVGRLKGHLDVLGPDPRQPGGRTEVGADAHYQLRRAIPLRAILRRLHPQLFPPNGAGGELQIDRGILRALLTVSQYRHGIRSMESVVAMSALHGRIRFERSSLPAESQLDLHVDGNEFMALVQQPPVEGALLENLARAMHERFSEALSRKGYRPGRRTDERRKTHSAMREFGALPTDEQEQNRDAVRDIIAKLALARYVLRPLRLGAKPFTFAAVEVERLAEIEHERWLRLKLRQGWRWGASRDGRRRLHPDMRPWRSLTSPQRDDRYTVAEQEAMDFHPLPEREKDKDRDLIRAIPELFLRAGYTIVPMRDRSGAFGRSR